MIPLLKKADEFFGKYLYDKNMENRGWLAILHDITNYNMQAYVKLSK